MFVSALCSSEIFTSTSHIIVAIGLRNLANATTENILIYTSYRLLFKLKIVNRDNLAKMFERELYHVSVI